MVAMSVIIGLLVQNPSDVVREDWPVVVPLEHLVDGGLEPGADSTLLVTSDGEPVPSQLDDLDGDGRFDELVFVADFDVREQRAFQVSVVPKTKAPQFEQRANALFMVKRGGEFEEREFEGEVMTRYIGGELEAVTHHVVPPEHGAHDGLYAFEGPGWESDKVAYRLHLDARNTIDTFGKIVKRMALEKVDPQATGSHNPSFLNMQPWGKDTLWAQDSLGLGSLGAVSFDETVERRPDEEPKIDIERLAEVEKRIVDVVADGPVRAIVRITYEGWHTDQGVFDVVHEMRIVAGQYWFENRITVFNRNGPVTLASGMVIHLEDLIVSAHHGINWMATHGSQEADGDILGLALFFHGDETLPGHTIGQDGDSYFFPIKMTSGHSVSYYAMAAWEQTESRWREEADFRRYVDSIAQSLAEPLEISIEDRSR